MPKTLCKFLTGSVKYEESYSHLKVGNPGLGDLRLGLARAAFQSPAASNYHPVDATTKHLLMSNFDASPDPYVPPPRLMSIKGYRTAKYRNPLPLVGRDDPLDFGRAEIQIQEPGGLEDSDLVRNSHESDVQGVRHLPGSNQADPLSQMEVDQSFPDDDSLGQTQDKRDSESSDLELDGWEDKESPGMSDEDYHKMSQAEEIERRAEIDAEAEERERLLKKEYDLDDDDEDDEEVDESQLEDSPDLGSCRASLSLVHEFELTLPIVPQTRLISHRKICLC